MAWQSRDGCETVKLPKLCSILVVATISVVLFLLVFTYFDKTSMPRTFKDMSKLWRKEQNHSRIIRFETSGSGTVSLRFLTGLESAALWNPNKEVILHFFSDKSLNLTASMKGLQDRYPNIKYETTSIEDFVRHTPLEVWYREGKWRDSLHKKTHLSDGARLLDIWRSGGIYLDLDIIVLKSLDLPKNAVARGDGKNNMGNSFLAFQAGHPLMTLSVSRFVENYDPNDYTRNGPVLMTFEAEKYIRILGDYCDVELLPSRTVNPTMYPAWKNYFMPEQKLVTLEKAKGSFGAHWWNGLSMNTRITTETDCAFMELVKANCPYVYSLILEQGWV